jgi:hypothetical protein
VNTKTYSVKVTVIGTKLDYKDIENNTEEEDNSDYDPISVAAARAMARLQRKDAEPLSQGPVLN